MTHIDKLKKQADIISKVYNIFKRAKMAGNSLKIATNAKVMKQVIATKFKDIARIVPQAPTNVGQGTNVLKKYVLVLNKKYDAKISESEVLAIFKQVYSYMTKSLIALNAAGIAGATVTASLSPGWAILIVPFSVVATISIFTNARKHGISFQQSIANFKKSFKEFLDRDKYTKKEKAFAYMPYLVISVAIFILQSSWANASIEKILKKTVDQTIGKKVSKSGIEAAKDVFKSVGIKYKEKGNILNKITVKEFVIVFSAAFIVYLLLSVLDQMILRKGEASSEV